MSCSSDFRRRAPGIPRRASQEGEREKLAGWVARTRPLAEPLSPRGPQPVPRRLQTGPAPLNGPPEPRNRVPESWYALFAARGKLSWPTSLCNITYLFSMHYRKNPLGIYAFLDGFVLLVPSSPWNPWSWGGSPVTTNRRSHPYLRCQSFCEHPRI